MIRLLNLGPAKHEKAAIYVVNQRISNVLELREHEMRSNPCVIGGKRYFDLLTLASVI